MAVVILVVAIGLETFSFAPRWWNPRPLKGRSTWWQFIRRSRNPELPVVLLEDTGALLGLLFALGGVGLTVLTGDPVWDGVGTMLIGALLGVIAVILMVEMPQPADRGGRHRRGVPAIQAALEGTDRIDRVIHLRTQYLGPDEMLVAAKIARRGHRPGHRRRHHRRRRGGREPPYRRRRSSTWNRISIARWRFSPAPLCPPQPHVVSHRAAHDAGGAPCRGCRAG